MANPEHVAVAKRRAFAIARWRAQFFQRRERMNLSGAYLSGVRMPGVDLAYDDLTEIDLTSADLRNANFTGASLQLAHLSRCNLTRATFTDSHAAGASFIRSDLRGCNLDNADLRGADLSNCDIAFATLVGANLAGANLTETDLTMADLTGANLSGARLNSACLDVANLTGCDLRRTSLVRTRLDRTLLQDCVVEMTLFGDCDLSSVLALDTIRHEGPSIVGADTLARSAGCITEVFLRAAGVPADFIDGRAPVAGFQRLAPAHPAHRVGRGFQHYQLAGNGIAATGPAVLEPVGRRRRDGVQHPGFPADEPVPQFRPGGSDVLAGRAGKRLLLAALQRHHPAANSVQRPASLSGRTDYGRLPDR